ncbi:DUF551 domain-containing protein [Salmonella enterica]|nr:hypothetical protein [Salmonella enterica subsp. houtenae]EAS9472419.1 DUF551 domain-containing protein [Salmonella enterica]EDX2009856.1 DUF551 domain-containing protein [Salmonella enterica subsp. enterica]EHB8800093.1 DUF551 domain-containing protein [Salmonella enterica subsp. enterica serovar Rough O:z4,z23:-]EEL5126095.1 DUF551 domain-containing protein [Salmonella enterica]
MTAITREQQKQILIDTANHVISRDNTSQYSENLRELARIALASLDAEPVAYIFKHPAGELFWALTDKSNKGQNDVIPVYAVPPASVTGIYDDILNIIGLLENNEWAEHCTSTVLGSLLESEITRLVSKEQSVPVVPEEIEPDSNNTYDYVDGWNACRAAMLQGAEPVSQTYELPQTQLEQIADLYEMQFDDGRTCAFHTDGAKAAQWLLACDGNKVQEYVRIERYQEAVIGNSPVTPDGWISCSERMPEQGAYISAVSKHGEYVAGQVIDDWLDLHDGTSFGLDEVYLWMMLPPLPASPQQ